MKQAFYVPNRPWIIDDAQERADGVWVSVIAGLTLEEIQAKYPGAVLTTLKAATAAIEAICKTVPRPIDEVDFCYAQSFLKNYDRAQVDESETFKMSEHKYDRITAIYARIGDSFWTFDDVAETSHHEIVERIQNRLRQHQIIDGAGGLISSNA